MKCTQGILFVFRITPTIAYKVYWLREKYVGLYHAAYAHDPMRLGVIPTKGIGPLCKMHARPGTHVVLADALERLQFQRREFWDFEKDVPILLETVEGERCSGFH
jgi:hypothetical protein